MHLPYSGKFSRGAIFAEGQSSKISRSNFHGWPFQNCSAHNTWLTPPLTTCATSAFVLQNELISIKVHHCNHSHSQQLVFLSEIVVQEKTSHSGLFFVDQNFLWFRSLASLLPLADCMDDDGTVVDRGPRGSGSLVVLLDVLK